MRIILVLTTLAYLHALSVYAIWPPTDDEDSPPQAVSFSYDMAKYTTDIKYADPKTKLFPLPPSDNHYWRLNDEGTIYELREGDPDPKRRDRPYLPLGEVTPKKKGPNPLLRKGPRKAPDGFDFKEGGSGFHLVRKADPAQSPSEAGPAMPPPETASAVEDRTATAPTPVHLLLAGGHLYLAKQEEINFETTWVTDGALNARTKPANNLALTFHGKGGVSKSSIAILQKWLEGSCVQEVSDPYGSVFSCLKGDFIPIAESNTLN